MILNMPVNNGAPNNTAVILNQGQTEYTNFLKRKYNDHEMDHNTACSLTPNYEESNVSASNNWKKRHIDELLEEEEPQTHLNETLANSYSSSNTEPFKQQHLNETQESSAVGSFNIIANNSSFLNDLFAYDANLLVPVTVNSLSDSILTDSVTFSTPSTISANAKTDFDDDNNGDHWQASDLLELDHRYNSSLQMEISQLNPTTSLENTEEHSSNLLITNQASNPAANESHQFVLPQKPITPKRLNTALSSTTTATSCSSSSSSPAVSNYNGDQDCDFEDKNLSWLLNFKFDEFPHLNPDVNGLNSSQKSTNKTSNFFGNSPLHSSSNHYNTGLTSSPSQSTVSQQGKVTLTTCATGTANGTTIVETSKSPKTANKTGKKFEELVMEVTSEIEVNDMVVAENVVIEETSYRAPKKPPFTYTELIEYALEDKGELTVSGIYQWISDRFPYYKSNDDRWKNSVRHNLSINPHFRKGHKAPQGAGHLWTISSGDSAENVLAWEHKKQRLDLFFKMESMNRERLQQYQQKQQQEKLRNQTACPHDGCASSASYDEAAIAAANIEQEMLQQQNHNNNDANMQNQNSLSQTLQEATNNHHNLHDLHTTSSSSSYNDLLTDEELRKTAGQILNGIHREVEVQAVNQSLISTYQDVLLDNDYLNPIHKDVVVNESGLRHSSHTTISPHCHSNTHSSSSFTGPYFVTEIDPLELGIHTTSHHHQHHQSTSSHNQHNHHSQSSTTVHQVGEESDVVLFNDEFNLNYFTYNPNNDIVA